MVCNSTGENAMKKDPSKNWWWKKFLAIDKSDKRRAWFDGHQAVAFHWELARRNWPLSKYPTFKELSKGEYDIAYLELSKKFGGFKSPAVVSHFPYVKYESSRVSFPDKLWNLQDSKNALQKAFWQLIEAARKERGIDEPERSKTGKGAKSRNAGNNARTKGGGQSWTWLELMDNPHGLKRSNDRSHLSAARKRCAELENDFLSVWKVIEEHRRHLKLHPENKVDREPVKW
jgi:hypothetical protein